MCNEIRQKNDELSWEIRILGRSWYCLDFVSRIICTLSLERQRIRRWGGYRSFFHASTNVHTENQHHPLYRVSEFCKDHSIETSYVTGSSRHDISRQNRLGIQTFQHVQTRCGLRNLGDKFGVAIWSNECKNADRMNIRVFMAGPARMC